MGRKTGMKGLEDDGSGQNHKARLYGRHSSMKYLEVFFRKSAERSGNFVASWPQKLYEN
jgi:hypothetical protein